MSLSLTQNEPLAPKTTLKVGGPAANYVAVSSESELVEAVAYARAHELRLTILAGGSNVLIADSGIEGLVVQMNIKGVEVKQNGGQVFLTVAAGEILDEVIMTCVEKDYWGLENLSHIPGTVGATPVQNVGAYGVEVASRIVLVRVLDCETESFTTLNREQCNFAYRDSLFKRPEGKKYIITNVTFLLSTTPHPEISYRDLAERLRKVVQPTLSEIRKEVISIRGNKFPDWHEVGTAGSFFKNPIIAISHYQSLLEIYPELPSYPVDNETVKIPLAWILDKALKIKGFSTENVGVYDGQALVLINHGGATAEEIINFAETIVARVKKEFAIDVEFEVTQLK